MKTWLVVGALVLLAAAAGQAGAAEKIVVERGTDGLSAVPFRAKNTSGSAIECDAATAHWYSVVVGRAEPGGEVAAELWSDPATGAVYVLNDKTDRMPIQTLWCGLAGAPVSTRADIWLMRKAGGVEAPIDLQCVGRTPGGMLDCRRQ